MDDIKKLIDDLRHMQGLGRYGANGQAADSLERLSDENTKLRKSLSSMANSILGYIIDACERDETTRLLLQPEIKKIAELLKCNEMDWQRRSSR